MTVAVVTAVYRNSPTLPELVRRVDAALRGQDWRLRFVVDGSPDDSLAVATHLAGVDARLAVTNLTGRTGQHRALTRGLADEPDEADEAEPADAWVCLDADLQDPPDAIPHLVSRLEAGDLDAVFAGRAGAYEGRGRLLTGRLHRAALARLAPGLPRDAGAFVALGPRARSTILALQPPSIVAGLGVAGLRMASVPVVRSVRPSGRSAWTASARVRQSATTLAWAARAQAARSAAGRSHRWTSTTA